ncbi:hypothetical protein HGM15179_010901 [Zosterops borbonicus]|uniref:non-specific serine/threonine protein kinase n=1 Tax=Zosterops borbonicus TaxID=364589 RepID=A0A8K1GDM9_9PASS|nr:hypothetical protein HGM15179_010901 [Zosterops borbonicus]
MGPGDAGAEPALGWFLRDGSSGAIYRRERLLGEGTFGRCYRVSEVTSGRPYALKVIPRARLGAAGTGDRVQRELELQGRLRHPHLVRLHGHFTHSDRLCLLLELCARGSLSQPLSLCPQSLADTVRARGRLTEPEVRFYLRQLLSGLRYLHGHGLVHRDLKLSNFLLTEKMRVKIGDLGLAQPAAPPGRRWGAGGAVSMSLSPLAVPVPLSPLGLAVSLSPLGLAVPLSPLGLAVSLSPLGLAVPLSPLAVPVPLSPLGLAVSLSPLGLAVSLSPLGLAVPLSPLGLAVPLSPLAVAVPLPKGPEPEDPWRKNLY